MPRPWNKGLKIGETHPQIGFQKGNKNYEDPRVKATQFKKGNSVSPQTQFQKGKEVWNKGKKGRLKHTEEWKQQRSKAMSGENHPMWKGGLAFRKPNEKKHLSSKYMGWVGSVKSRDGWKCKIANSDCNGRLEAHHILNWTDYPELRYEINNGITLCQAHHPKKWAKEKELISTFQELVSPSNVLLV